MGRCLLNIGNAILMVLAGVPLVLAYYWFLENCDSEGVSPAERPLEGAVFDLQTLTTPEAVCEYGIRYPAAFANVLFFFGICVLFWILNIVQGSTWLIDPYWTFIPVMLAVYYRLHPTGEADLQRGRMAMVAILTWSARLTHSYFRREEFQFGAREDWRFAQYRANNPYSWWWMSLFVAYLSQQVMLFGITLPLYHIYSDASPWNAFDTAAMVLCMFGIGFACTADSQLHQYMVAKAEAKKNDEPFPVVLDTGVWRYSRRPNYFGEQCFWWGLWLFNAGQGYYYTVWGTVFNSFILWIVTDMTEKRMLSSRPKEYAEYMRRTSVWIPWFPAEGSASTTDEDAAEEPEVADEAVDEAVDEADSTTVVVSPAKKAAPKSPQRSAGSVSSDAVELTVVIAGVSKTPEEMTYNELRKELKRRGLRAVGRKPELIERMQEDLEREHSEGGSAS
mmetsp:Transcript_17909/g.50452  ORF Transcript_17909/g.50452 Transcript_17909/m.50452 type:complete len:448 (+) Transcript_17909:3-1346(+)